MEQSLAAQPTQLARDHHYLPQALLQRWSLDGSNVQAFRTLVSNKSVPEWEPRSIRGSGYQRDLYTKILLGGESDELERWFATEYESPGMEASSRLVAGKHLNGDDFAAIIRFVTLQHLRTPRAFFDFMTRMDKSLPELMQKTTHESLEKLRVAKERGEALCPDPEWMNHPFADLFKVQIEKNEGGPGGLVTTEVSINRRLWLASMQHLLTGRAGAKLHEHDWVVWTPSPGQEWPLTDDPSIRLNLYPNGKYDFGGGWGKPGSRLFMPLSPTHLFYAEVGRRSTRKQVLSEGDTQWFQRLLVERAYRWIFGTQGYSWVPALRERTIDIEKFNAEQVRWKNWSEEQRLSEAGS